MAQQKNWKNSGPNSSMVTVFVKNVSANVEHWALVCPLQEMQDDQQKQLKDMKENIGYYQKKAQELEVKHKEQ